MAGSGKTPPPPGKPRPVESLLDCPVRWDGHTFFVCLERQTHGIFQRLWDAMREKGMAHNCEMVGSVVGHDEAGGIVVHFNQHGVINMEVPKGAYIVIY